jgi:hypothetical protein
MVNVKEPGKYTRSVRPLVPRSPEEEHLALYARGPDDLDAALAGVSREDLDRARPGHRTIRQIVEHAIVEDARWTMCMQVALARPGYTHGHEWVSRKRTEPWAGSGAGRAHAVAPLVTLVRANRTHERLLQLYLRALHARGWQRRLAPLVQHMAQRHLVRGRGEDGAPLRRLDFEVLREALSRMLHQEWAGASLIVQLVVVGAEPALVAAERGVNRAVLVEQLRDAVDELAMEYENVAYAGVVET